MTDLDLALLAARAGAAIVADAFGTATETELKGRFDPVTVVDRAAERAIVDIVRVERPDDGILAEEGSGSATRGRRWIIDPLDGTVNFVHGIPHVGVSVALYKDDAPLVGVTIDPLRAEEYVAVAGGGATLNGSPITTSATIDPERAVIATGFPYDHDVHADALARTLGAVLARVNGLRRMGSATLDLAWVAAGRYEGYWELNVSPWDIAAGILLVREAGGTVTTPAGGPAAPDQREIVAANPHLHEVLRSTVAATLD